MSGSGRNWSWYLGVIRHEYFDASPTEPVKNPEELARPSGETFGS